MLKKPDPNASDAYAPPKLGPSPSAPPPAPAPRSAPPRAAEEPEGFHAAMHPASSALGGQPSSRAPATEPAAETVELTTGYETPIETATVQAALGMTREEHFESDESDQTGKQSDSELIKLRSDSARRSGRGQFNDEKTIVSAGPPSSRTSRPPPLPPMDRASESFVTPRSPEVLDETAAHPGYASLHGFDLLLHTDENPSADTGEEAASSSLPGAFPTDPSLEAPDDEEVIIVDDIAEEVEEEEAPPHTEQEGASASSVPPPHSRP
jgi:hypothetical protein